MKVAGAARIQRTSVEVRDRLRLAMSAGNFEVVEEAAGEICFRHGTYLTQSAPLLPKRGILVLRPEGDVTDVGYEIELVPFATAWLSLFAVVFCWLIFPPYVVYRALVHHPRRLMENLLAGL